MRKAVKLFGVVAVLSLAVGCAPTIRQIPESMLKDEERKVSFEEGRKQGFADGVTVTRAEYDGKMTEFMNQYKGELLYVEAVKAGILRPGQVEMAYSPGAVSGDGGSFSAPAFKWRVTSPPQFQADESMRWWKKDEANFCYLFLRDYPDQRSALQAVASVEKPGSVLLTAMPYSDGTGRWAVIAKTIADVCDDAVSLYQARGFSPVRVQ